MRSLNDAIPNLADYLARAADERGDRLALVAGADRWTFAELEHDSNRLAHRLVRSGVRRGDRVLVFMDNCPETVIAFWGVLKANAVVSVVNPLTKSAKLQYLLEDCRPTGLIASAKLARVFRELAARSAHLEITVVAGHASDALLDELPGACRWEQALEDGPFARPPARRTLDIDLAAIVYTSGSTGDPKGVMLTHRNMLTAASSVSTYLGLCADDVILDVLPLAFDYGLYQMIMACAVGARLVLERSFAYPAQVLETMVDQGVSVFPGVPTMFAVLAGMDLTAYDLSRLRLLTNTAADLPHSQIAKLAELFPAARIVPMYGLTECKRCTYLPPEDVFRKPGSVGVAIPNTELWLVDEHDNRLGPGQVGQLVVRGATVMAGYWEKPEQTANKLRPGPLPGERVLYTGDLCRLDEDGYLYFVGRMDDIIKSRGEKVPPVEVEQALTSIEGVREAAVIGVADETLGQAIKAFVVLEPQSDMTQRTLLHLVGQRLESFMVPKHIELVSALPRGSTGKIDKKVLS